MQNKPVMCVQFVVRGRRFFELLFHRQRRLSRRQTCAITDSEDMRIDRNRRLTECHVENHIGRLPPYSGKRFERIPVCVAYDVDGVRHDEIPMTQTGFHHAKPIYECLPGWSDDISDAQSVTDLPAAARDYVAFLEEVSRAPISAIGVGPDRDATIVVRDLL